MSVLVDAYVDSRRQREREPTRQEVIDRLNHWSDPRILLDLVALPRAKLDPAATAAA